MLTESLDPRIRSAIHSLPCAGFLTSLDGTLLECNESAQIRLPEPVVHGHGSLACMLEHDIAQLLLSDIPAGSHPKECTTRWHDGSGVLHETDWNVLPTPSVHGEREGWLFVERLTRSWQEEARRHSRLLERERRLANLSVFSGAASHELNNLLMTILGYSELVLSSADPASEICQDLLKVVNASKRAEELLRQTLMVSKSGSKHLHMLRADVVVKETLKAIRAALPDHLSLRYEISDEPVQVCLEPLPIHHLTIALCVHALDAISYSGGEICVALHSVKSQHPNSEFDRSRNAFTLEVSTSHVGNEQLATRNQGELWNLSSTSRLVHDMSGELEISTCTRGLPRYRAILPTVIATPGAEPQIARPLIGEEQVLLVHPDADILARLGMCLRVMGYVVGMHTDWFDALASFQRQPALFDLVISGTEDEIASEPICPEVIRVFRPGIPFLHLARGASNFISRETVMRDRVWIPIDCLEFGLLVREALDV